MATPVVMPQMGESIAEGTIVRWIKKVGDQVDRDEPLFEISTDKVDAEIPSPVAGVLTEIKVAEGETVPVNSVVGTIGQAASAASAPPAMVTPAAPAASAQADGGGASAAASTASPAAVPAAAAAAASSASVVTDDGAAVEARPRTSPLVRRMAKEHDLDLTRIDGSGEGGRVTRRDMQRVIDSRARTHPAADAALASRGPVYRDGERVEIQPLSIMRKKIAEHMVLSRRTSAHVHSVFHVNFTAVARLREKHRAEYERQGVKLTFMGFITRAVTVALGRHPFINASLDGSNIVFKKDVNLGIAVALEGGLIVPVVKGAAGMTMLALCRSVADVAERARTKQLKPDEVHGGTFTITNPGQFGAQFGMPIINQPQVAILGVGTVEKRPVVVDDAIGIRTMAYLTLGYDHRLIDGATADRFMADVKQLIEEFNESDL